MKKNRSLEKNQIVVACLFFICVLLVFTIFFISNQAIPAVQDPSACVTREEVVEAYSFLHQDEAVQRALDSLPQDEMFTYGAYQDFLKQLHLWEAGRFEALFDWEELEKKGVTRDVLSESRDVVAELFEMNEAGQEHPDVPEETKAQVSVPEVDEHTIIRVLLLQNGAPVAPEIRFSSNEAYEISWNGIIKEKKKNQIIRAGQLKLKVGQTAIVQSEKGELYLADTNGNRDTLGFNGIFRITRYEDGYAVVNEVEIEDYLYGVVQSEMPAYFEEEALKAQAVCARTYIVTQLMQENYPKYRADVDDTVRFQVYNKAAPDARVVDAVDATRGQILSIDGVPIQAYFFSTSHGITSGREIWGLPSPDYLQPVRGSKDVSGMDLSDEETFRGYIRESHADDYDASSDYYRWKATLDMELHLADVKTRLQELEEIQADCVIIRDSHGIETNADAMNEWTNMQQLKVLERSSSGAVLRLLMVFSEGEAELTNEHVIRQILGLCVKTLQDKEGDQVNVGELLPSVYFYVQPIKEGIVLFGGGLGHGIGMSQYGANGFAKQGADMMDILKFYYRDVDIQQLYPDKE